MKTAKEYYDDYNQLHAQVRNDITFFCRYMKPGETVPFDIGGLALVCDSDAYITGLQISDTGDVDVTIDRGDGVWSIYSDSLNVLDLISIYEECLSS